MSNGHSYDPEIDDTSVSSAWAVLRIYSGTISSKEITDRLGVTPTEVVTKGVCPRLNSPPAEKHAWLLSSEELVSVRDARAHLDAILDPLMGAKDELIELTALPDVKASVQLYWWALEGSSPVFWPEQMAKLAELGLEFTIQFVQVDPDDKKARYDA